MSKKQGEEKRKPVHADLFSSPNFLVKKGHFLVGQMGSASGVGGATRRGWVARKKGISLPAECRTHQRLSPLSISDTMSQPP